MTTVDQTATRFANPGWFSQGVAWLDDKGKAAWIALMVLGFVFFWPIGLAILFYMIWSKRMCSHSYGRMSRHNGFSTRASTGNRAFDAYKTETLRRLEDEQKNFETFLERLREAKDKAEFDEFMDERAKSAAASRNQNDSA